MPPRWRGHSRPRHFFIMNNPIQPLSIDSSGPRFKANEIVRYLIDTHQSCDMNVLASMDFTTDDREQFAQLIGYSLNGFSELSYVSDTTYSAAEAMSKDSELKSLEAKYAALFEKMNSVAEKAREAVAELYEIHPDDLKRGF